MLIGSEKPRWGEFNKLLYCIVILCLLCRNPRLADKTIVFSEHEVSKVVAMVTR